MSVACLGLATLDTILAVPRHPDADDRVVATAHARAGGGPAATAAVALARLGVDVTFVGAVGDDAEGREIVSSLEREGVDVSELAVVEGARSPQSSILVSPRGRAIAHFPGTAGPIAPSGRALELMRAAEWVHVDHAGYAVAPPGVRLSVDGGNPIPGIGLDGVALYAPTDTALERDFGTPARALAAGAELVVVTKGAQGCAAHTPGEAVEVAGEPLEGAVSTLGAGDVFHGALLAAFVRGLPLRDALAFANRAAALSCRALDGRSAIPTMEEME